MSNSRQVFAPQHSPRRSPPLPTRSAKTIAWHTQIRVAQEQHKRDAAKDDRIKQLEKRVTELENG